MWFFYHVVFLSLTYNSLFRIFYSSQSEFLSNDLFLHEEIQAIGEPTLHISHALNEIRVDSSDFLTFSALSQTVGRSLAYGTIFFLALECVAGGGLQKTGRVGGSFRFRFGHLRGNL